MNRTGNISSRCQLTRTAREPSPVQFNRVWRVVGALGRAGGFSALLVWPCSGYIACYIERSAATLMISGTRADPMTWNPVLVLILCYSWSLLLYLRLDIDAYDASETEAHSARESSHVRDHDHKAGTPAFHQEHSRQYPSRSRPWSCDARNPAYMRWQSRAAGLKQACGMSGRDSAHGGVSSGLLVAERDVSGFENGNEDTGCFSKRHVRVLVGRVRETWPKCVIVRERIPRAKHPCYSFLVINTSRG